MQTGEVVAVGLVSIDLLGHSSEADDVLLANTEGASASVEVPVPPSVFAAVDTNAESFAVYHAFPFPGDTFAMTADSIDLFAQDVYQNRFEVLVVVVVAADSMGAVGVPNTGSALAKTAVLEDTVVAYGVEDIVEVDSRFERVYHIRSGWPAVVVVHRTRLVVAVEVVVTDTLVVAIQDIQVVVYIEVGSLERVEEESEKAAEAVPFHHTFPFAHFVVDTWCSSAALKVASSDC